MHDTTFEQITENLKRALDIVENCGEAYKNASDTIKKLMNQAIFEKFYISNDADMEFKVDAEFKPPFDQILEPLGDPDGLLDIFGARIDARCMKIFKHGFASPPHRLTAHTSLRASCWQTSS